jgi:hypothetical protein
VGDSCPHLPPQLDNTTMQLTVISVAMTSPALLPSPTKASRKRGSPSPPPAHRVLPAPSRISPRERQRQEPLGTGFYGQCIVLRQKHTEQCVHMMKCHCLVTASQAWQQVHQQPYFGRHRPRSTRFPCCCSVQCLPLSWTFSHRPLSSQDWLQ